MTFWDIKKKRKANTKEDEQDIILRAMQKNQQDDAEYTTDGCTYGYRYDSKL